AVAGWDIATMWYVIAGIGALDAMWVRAAKIEMDIRSLLLAVAAVAVLYAAIDHALGLDWQHWYALVNAQPLLSWLFSAAYQSAGMEIFLGLILLPLF